ncbi:MAG: 7-cyano-7-deazaguanine synthase [Gemmataceae bacterium]|nr:7-cyano-7-deazaguanine synthase [Gemmataceae bacterium]
MQRPDPAQPLAVLVSGGVDSAVLLGLAARLHPAVHPIYVRTGLVWEDVERAYLDRFLAAIAGPALRPLIVFDQPARDLYGNHWSATGTAPDAHAPDEDFYLPGRNVLLLAKPLIWCRMHAVPTLALATLAANPFPDATPEFFAGFADVVSRAVGGHVAIATPYSGLTKVDVIRSGSDLPLEHTLSCVAPRNGRHCGVCGKCAERGRAFLAAGVSDPTEYLSRAWEGTTQRTADHRPWENPCSA